jgi:lipoprotein-releasing system ATP-binding protein
MDNGHILECHNLRKIYHTGEEDLEVLAGLDFHLKADEFVSITGESGCGKSTLLHLLGCLDEPTEGEVHYNGTNVSGLSQTRRDQLRNRDFGFVFQFHYLLPEFSALENVQLPGLIAGESSPKISERANQLLDELKLSNRKDFKPYKLSGGEQQRVAVARALINQPSIVFMDEPTGNLDPYHTEEMIHMIAEQQKKKRLAIVMVTHNQEIARLADRQFQLKNGILNPS